MLEDLLPSDLGEKDRTVPIAGHELLELGPGAGARKGRRRDHRVPGQQQEEQDLLAGAGALGLAAGSRVTA